MAKNILMKLLVAVLFCLPVLTRSVAQNNASRQTGSKTKVETSYDEKKGETIARIGPFELYRPPQNSVSGELNFERIDLTVSFSYPGKRIAKPLSVMLVVFAASEGGARFEKKRDLSFKTDSGQYDLGEMEFVGKGEGYVQTNVSRGQREILVSEVLRKSIPFDQFAQIAKSGTAEIKIGRSKLRLEKKHLEAFRNFVYLMEQEGLEF